MTIYNNTNNVRGNPNLNAFEINRKSFLKELIQKIISLITSIFFSEKKTPTSEPINKNRRVSIAPTSSTDKTITTAGQTLPPNPPPSAEESIKPIPEQNAKSRTLITGENLNEYLTPVDNDILRNIQQIVNIMINGTKDKNTINRLYKSLNIQIQGLERKELQTFARNWSTENLKKMS